VAEGANKTHHALQTRRGSSGSARTRVPNYVADESSEGREALSEEHFAELQLQQGQAAGGSAHSAIPQHRVRPGDPRREAVSVRKERQLLAMITIGTLKPMNERRRPDGIDCDFIYE